MKTFAQFLSEEKKPKKKPAKKTEKKMTLAQRVEKLENAGKKKKAKEKKKKPTPLFGHKFDEDD